MSTEEKPSMLKELVGKLSSGELSSRDLCEGLLRRVQKWNPTLRAILSIEEDRVMQRAEELDRRRGQGADLGVLGGIPVGVKDNLCSRVGRTTCGSRMLENFKSPYDSHVVSRLDDSGAVLFGKTNLDEFAMGGSTETSFFGASRNPWDFERTCGGSSGGSAAAVAAGLVPVSIGTDTGGSIRQPAAFCGVCGIKPTYGRVSRWGLVSYASSLDVAGVFGQSVEDLALVLGAIAGHDPRDSTCLPHSVPSYSESLNQGVRGMRIGVLREQLDSQGLDPQVRSAILSALDVYRELGAEIVDVSLPHSKYCIATYYVIAPCEASSNLARYDGVHYGYRSSSKDAGVLDRMMEQTRSEGFGKEVQRRILLGTYALSAGYYDAYYLQALKVRRLIRQDYDEAFSKVDLLLGPTTPQGAFRLGEKLADPIQLYLQDLFTVGANLAGIPAMSIPVGAGMDTGLPIGLQLQAPVLREDQLFRAGAAYHRAIAYQFRLPATLEEPRV
jgi:aspartyl-tRNA(Asn)/glutamyl-tRNA(Gln) amidotransferase subunit A